MIVLTTTQRNQLISAIKDGEAKIKYLLSLEIKHQDKINKLLAIEFIKLTLSIGEEEVDLMYDLINKEVEENSTLSQEQRDLTFAAVLGLSLDDTMEYMGMSLEDLEVLSKTLFDELEI
jgi:hypothetical protein